MKILIMRHSTAVAYHTPVDDSHRWLTDVGRDRARAAVATLKEANLLPTKIISSPYVRAVQTASIVAESCPELTLSIHPPLGLEIGTTAMALSILESIQAQTSASERVMLVSHQPKVEKMSRSLTNTDIPGFATASICAIDYESSNFEWWLDGRSGKIFREPGSLPQ